MSINPMPNHNMSAWNAFQNNKLRVADILDISFRQCTLCKSSRLTVHMNYIECRDCGCQFFGIRYNNWNGTWQPEHYEIYLYLAGEWIPLSKWKREKRKIKIKVLLL